MARRKINTAILLCILFLQTGQLLAYFNSGTCHKRVDHLTEPKLSVMLWNTWQANDDYEEVYRTVKDVNPHIILLQESHKLVVDELPNKLMSYHSFYVGDNLFFIRKNDSLEIISFEQKEIGTIKGGNINFRWNNTVISLLGIHLSTPISRTKMINREYQVEDILSWINEQNNTQILIGDLNTTPWSKESKSISKRLYDSMKGYGVQSTWPFHNKIISIMRIPLDNCFHSCDIITSKRYVGDSKSSNHRPLVIEFQKIGNNI